MTVSELPLAPSWELAIGSWQASSDESQALVSVVVERGIDVPVDGAMVTIIGMPNLEIGGRVSIDLGYGSRRRCFTGTVTSLRPSHGQLTIWAVGSLRELAQARLSAVYERRTVGGIVRDVAGQLGADTAMVEEGPELPVFVLDPNRGALAQLRGLATRLGFDLFADRDGALVFGPLDSAPAASDRPLELTYGRDMLGVGRRRGAASWSRVTVGGESPMSEQGSDTAPWPSANDGPATASAGDGSSSVVVIDPLARTTDLAEAFADGLLASVRHRADGLELRIPGHAECEIGAVARLSDVPWLDGDTTATITAVSHRVGGWRGFVTDLSLRLQEGP